MTMTTKTTIQTNPIIRVVVVVVVVVMVLMVLARIGNRNKNVVAETRQNIVAMHQQPWMTIAALVVLALKFKRPNENLGTIFFWWHRSARRENRREISSKPRANRTSATTITQRRLQENAIKKTVTSTQHQKKNQTKQKYIFTKFTTSDSLITFTFTFLGVLLSCSLDAFLLSLIRRTIPLECSCDTSQTNFSGHFCFYLWWFRFVLFVTYF